MKAKKLSHDRVLCASGSQEKVFNSAPLQTKPLEVHSGTSSSSSVSRFSDQEQNNIVNISDILLTADECSVLHRGLNFCPATGGHSEFQLLKDLDNFARNLRLREYFYDRPNSSDSKHALPSGKHWVPPSQHDRFLDMYIKAVQRDILQLYKNQAPFRRNLSINEMKALDTQASRNDIIIRPADKGGAVVIMNKSNYAAEAHRQLADATFYKRLDHDPTEQYKSLVKSTVLDLVKKKKVPDNAVHSLIPLSPVAGRFYRLPKIHKINNPGRPINSGIGTVTENLSSYVDSLISNIPATFSSYVRDTTDFLSDTIDLIITQGSLLVTLYVASLYTNIPHSDGIMAVVNCYEAVAPAKLIDSDTLATLLTLILELNNFEFEDSTTSKLVGRLWVRELAPTTRTYLWVS